MKRPRPPDSVYLVTDGEYSSYRVRGAFSTRDRAKRYVEYLNKTMFTGARIERSKMDDPQTEWATTIVRMAKDGTVIETWSTPTFDDPYGYPTIDWSGNLLVPIVTSDTKQAVKATNELRTIILSQPTDCWTPASVKRLLRPRKAEGR